MVVAGTGPDSSSLARWALASEEDAPARAASSPAVSSCPVAVKQIGAAVGAPGTILAGLAAMAAGCAGLLWAGHGTGYPALLAQQILLGVALFGALAASRFYPGLHTALWISIAVLAISALVSLPRMNVAASRL